ncbi:MAG TPA: hypothetical protein EYH20_08260 [Leucothrix sp.]|nr:hypothetical protein [Leucothrix sp.]
MSILKIFSLYVVILLLLSCGDYGTKISSLQWGKGMMELEFIFDDGLSGVTLQPKQKEEEYSGKSLVESVRYICKKTGLCKNYGIIVLSNASLYEERDLDKPDFEECKTLQTKYCNELKKNWLVIYSSGGSQIVTYPYIPSLRKVWLLKSPE